MHTSQDLHIDARVPFILISSNNDMLSGALETRVPCLSAPLDRARRGSTVICIGFTWGFYWQGDFFFTSPRVEQDLTENGMSKELLFCTSTN